eukprot:1048345-Alexandrium_andersonii.AAC.1
MINSIGRSSSSSSSSSSTRDRRVVAIKHPSSRNLRRPPALSFTHPNASEYLRQPISLRAPSERSALPENVGTR